MSSHPLRLISTRPAWLAIAAFLSVAAIAAAQDTLPGPGGASGEVAPAASGTLKTFEQQLGYSIGVNIGRELKQEGLPVDPAAVAAGVTEAFAGGQLRLTDEQRQQVFQQLQQVMRARQQQRGEQSRQAGAAFLAENAKKPGVQTTKSGLQYRVIQAGTGATPKRSDTVQCHYEGRLINGKVFDASKRHGPNPAQFPVGGVIAGWTEALQLMKVGAKWELFIPGNLAYGPRGSGPDIGPNETLVFTIELVGIANR